MALDIARPTAAYTVRLVRGFDRDQNGTISMVTVFAVLLLTMLLGMVMNVGRQVDGKIRLQNAADAAAYSGGVVIARGMNTLTFTNHVLFEVFSLTAFLREARDWTEQNKTELYIVPILTAWQNLAPVFANSNFPKFEALATAIPQKVPLERELVDTFCAWAAAGTQLILPELELILEEEMIPVFQREVVRAYPDIAQTAAMESARRNGYHDRGRGQMLGVLWRTNARPVGIDNEDYIPSDLYTRTLAAVDPVWDDLGKLGMAQEQRRRHAEQYLGTNQSHRRWRWGYWPSVRRLRDWNWPYWYRNWHDEILAMFDREARMSAFGSLWRSFTLSQLLLLFEENAQRNLPHVIEYDGKELLAWAPESAKEYINQRFTFVGVAYWQQLPEYGRQFFDKLLFKNPVEGDSLAYAEVRVFVPRRRLIWHRMPPPPSRGIGGIPGDFPDYPEGDSEQQDPSEEDDGGTPFVARQAEPGQNLWTLLNQRWTAQLVPCTQSALPKILGADLRTYPGFEEFVDKDIDPPSMGETTIEHIMQISPH